MDDFNLVEDKAKKRTSFEIERVYTRVCVCVRVCVKKEEREKEREFAAPWNPNINAELSL